MKAAIGFIRLDRHERVLFLLSILTMGGVRIALLCCTPRRIARSLDTINRALPRNAAAPRIPLIKLVKRVSQASRLSLIPTTCLSEAIAARALLARYGHVGELRIGIRKNEGSLDAHAWLECADGLLIGNPAPGGKRYVGMAGVEGLIR
jgi:hypothetical protein